MNTAEFQSAPKQTIIIYNLFLLIQYNIKDDYLTILEEM